MRIFDIIEAQPKQQQATLYSIITLYSKRKDRVFTGDVYDVYKSICLQTGLRPLTQRRISDVIAELDMLGIINADVISKGRGGRTRAISLALEPTLLLKIKKILEESLNF